MASVAIEFDPVTAQNLIHSMNLAGQRQVDGANNMAEVLRGRQLIHFEQMTTHGATAMRVLEGPPLNPGAGK